MSNLHVYIDGTWFFKVVNGGVFRRFLADSRNFKIDFHKLNQLMLRHVQQWDTDCQSLGNLCFVTSIFTLPSDFDNWPTTKPTIASASGSVNVGSSTIQKTKRIITQRDDFANDALKAGYKPDYIFRVPLQEWMLLNLVHPNLRYQEKQVDTTVVALLVRDAMEHPDDYFALVAGDADILPAVQVAYPHYTQNVFPVLTSPDEVEERNRQTSFKYSQFHFKIDTLVLQQHVGDIMEGDNVYQCTDCHKFFTTRRPIPGIQNGRSLPRCYNCRSFRYQQN